MDVFIKRFLKYNKSLVAVIGVSLVLVLFLLVIAVAKYLDMVQANNEVNKMRDTIVELQDPFKNKVAVIPGNLDLLKKDYDIYKAKNTELRPYLGHPYRKALDAMARVMKFKSGDEFVRDFYAFLEKGRELNEGVYVRYKRYAMEHSTVWNQAIQTFLKEAQKVSFEKITSANVDDIFMQAIGLPRDMYGRSQEQCADIIKNIEIQLNKHVLDKNIDINKEAVSFSLTTPGLSNSTQIADSMQNMEIVGDMISRIVKDAPKDRNIQYIRVLDSVQFLGKSPYRDDQKIIVYKYKLKMSVTMDALRGIIQNLNMSLKDNRVYVLRDLKMKMQPTEDQAAVVVGLVEAPVLRDKDGKVIEIKYRDESDLPYHKRRDYGKIMIGSNKFFDVEMELDYMILKMYEYQSR